jgi:prepilin-type N-terminal cleavage/methylation domain-containing protein
MFTRIIHDRSLKGFTLIELLVVISIIGLLSAVILASLNTARNKGYDAQRTSNMREVQKAIEAYYNDNGTYPSANGSYNIAGNSFGNYAYASQCQVGGNVAQNSVISGLVPNYIAQLPVDPQMVSGGGNPPTGNSCCYEYFVSSDGRNYKYMFFGCQTSASWTPSGPLTDPSGTYHHNNAWSVYSGTGTLF